VWAALVVLVLGYAAVVRFWSGESDRRFASIAVLPFDNIGGDAENEYFSDGITDDIIAQLTKLRDLKVISRTSTTLYKDARKSPHEIAQELGVATILRGSVRRQANRVRVVVNLIDARSDEQLWAESYDRDLNEIFSIQSDLAQQIALELLSRIPNDARARMRKQPTHDVIAYELYLRGRWLLHRRPQDGVPRAIDLFEQAIARDSAFALAHAGIADAYVVLLSYDPAPHGGEHERAGAAAERALHLDPRFGEARATLGYVRWYQWDWEGADADFRRALQLNPGYATAHQWYGLFLAAWGKPEAAEARMARALQLDPLSLVINAELGLVRFYARRYEDAIAQLRRTLEMDSTFALAYAFITRVYEQTGQYREAMAAHDRSAGHGATSHRDEELRRAFEREPTAENYYRLRISEAPAPEEGAGVEHARWNAALGNVDASIANLELGFRNHELLIGFIAAEPSFDPLHGHPRFEELLTRMNLR
jgi:TolB-like protein/Tfp pilus assembly protein PilF